MVSHPKGGAGRRAPTAASCPSTQAQPDKDRMVPLKEHPFIPAFLQGLKLQCWQSFLSSEPSSPELKCPCPQNPRFTRFYLLGLDLSYWIWIFSSSSAQQLLPQDLNDAGVLSCPPAHALIQLSSECLFFFIQGTCSPILPGIPELLLPDSDRTE